LRFLSPISLSFSFFSLPVAFFLTSLFFSFPFSFLGTQQNRKQNYMEEDDSETDVDEELTTGYNEEDAR